MRKGYVLTAAEWNIEQLSVAVKEPAKHVKINIILCFVQSSTMMVASEGSVIYHVVVVKVNNITYRALLDTGAGSFYASSSLLQKMNI